MSCINYTLMGNLHERGLSNMIFLISFDITSGTLSDFVIPTCIWERNRFLRRVQWQAIDIGTYVSKKSWKIAAVKQSELN